MAGSEPSSDGDPLDVMVIYGTRPEAIKMSPLVLALQNDGRFRVRVVVTGQHREMLAQVHRVFGITPDADLDIQSAGQTLTQVTTRTLEGLQPLLEADPPQVVLVQGDTTTTFAAALAGFYAQVPVVHTEAGLRTGNRYSPFPEEINRLLTTRLASLHLAPTGTSRANLLAEGISSDDIVVTGNSVIDALLETVAAEPKMSDPRLHEIVTSSDRKVVLVTVHRRESWGQPLRDIGAALAQLAERHTDHTFVVPLHLNPKVREAVIPAVEHLENVVVGDPLSYDEFCWMMNRSALIITDSGGVQEEGPSLGKPVMVLRENTERPEAVEAGTAVLVGTRPEAIVETADRLLSYGADYERMAHAVNPYGDGRAGERTVAALAHFLGAGPAAEPFDNGLVATAVSASQS